MTIINNRIATPTIPTIPVKSAFPTLSKGSLPSAFNLPESSYYQSLREPLWDIHEFVRQVLSKEAPGFHVTVKKNGDKRIVPLALGERFYHLMNNFMGRIPEGSQPAGFVGLFRDCCIELQLFYNPFGKEGDYHQPSIDGKDMNGAELFNALLELIRKRARSDTRCKDYLNFADDYDIDELKGIVEYFDDLFLEYSKILVVRVDLGYQADEADKINFERAHRDIQRFINIRRWYACFQHSIGYVVGRERGTGSVNENGGNGRSYHFHCFFLFDGQKVDDDVDLANKTVDYWGRILNPRGTPEDERIKAWNFNCNFKAWKSAYRYNGIGMVQQSDELKRWHMISAVIYLTKRTQGLGDDVPPRTRTLTKGVHKPRKFERRGRPRQIMIQGDKVTVPRSACRPGENRY